MIDVVVKKRQKEYAMKLHTIITMGVILMLGINCVLHGASRFSDSEIEELVKENKELRSELQKESKAAIEARNHAKGLFQELMRCR